MLPPLHPITTHTPSNYPQAQVRVNDTSFRPGGENDTLNLHCTSTSERQLDRCRIFCPSSQPVSTGLTFISTDGCPTAGTHALLDCFCRSNTMGNIQTSTAFPQLSPNEAQEDAPDCSDSIMPEQVAPCQFGEAGVQY